MCPRTREDRRRGTTLGVDVGANATDVIHGVQGVICEVPRCYSGDVIHYYRTGTNMPNGIGASPVGVYPIGLGHHIYCSDHAMRFLNAAICHHRRAGEMPQVWEGDNA